MHFQLLEKELTNQLGQVKAELNGSAASIACAHKFSRFILSALVNSVFTGIIRAAPSSVAFSMMNWVRFFLIGANNTHKSGGFRCICV